MLKKEIFKYLFIFIIIFNCIIYIFFNFRSFNNIDDRAFYSSYCDTGWFYHPIINFIKGHGFKSEGFSLYKQTDNLFGAHSFFIIYLYAIIIYFIKTPLVLFLSTPIVFALCGIYLYLIMKNNNFDIKPKIILSCLFFLNPQFYWAQWHGFYPVNIASFLLIPFFYYLQSKKLKTSFLVGIIIASCQEFMALIICLIYFIFLFYMCERKNKIYLFYFSLFFALYFLINFFLIIPAYSNFQPNNHFSLFYGYLGSNFKEIFFNIFFKYNDVFDVIFIKQKILFLFILFGSFLFFPLLNPLFFAALPHIIISLFATFPSLYDIRISYATPINTVLFLSSIFFIIRNKSKKKLNNNIFIFFILFILIVNYYYHSPSIFSRQFKNIYNCSNLTPRKIATKKIIQRYSTYNVSRICVTDLYSIYFSNFTVLTSFPFLYEKAEIIFLDKKYLTDSKTIEIVNDLKKNKSFTIDYEDKNIIVFKKINFKI